MTRLDPFGNELLPRLHYKSGRYYYVRHNKWTPLSKQYLRAVRQWTDLEDTQNGEWAALVALTYETYERRYQEGDLAPGTWRQYIQNMSPALQRRGLWRFQCLSVLPEFGDFRPLTALPAGIGLDRMTPIKCDNKISYLITYYCVDNN